MGLDRDRNVLAACGADRHFNGAYRLIVTMLLLHVLSACTSLGTHAFESTPRDSLHTIYVVRRAWHTGIAVAKADWPNSQWPVLAQFPDADYLEFGWGDARFYQAERNTFWLGVRAALWPSSSVVHVIGIRDPIVHHVAADDLAEVRIAPQGLRALTRSIENELATNPPVPIGNTLTAAPSPNRFYEAKGKFFFPRMCNWWIASRLHEAGCPITPWTVVSASRVMREARGFAECPTAR